MFRFRIIRFESEFSLASGVLVLSSYQDVTGYTKKSNRVDLNLTFDAAFVVVK